MTGTSPIGTPNTRTIMPTTLTLKALTLGVVLATAAPALLIAHPAQAQSSAQGFYEDARQRLEQGDVQAAIIQLRVALAEYDANFVPAKELLAELFIRTGQGGEAEDLARDLYDQDPNDTYQVLYARSLLAQRDPERFESNLERVIEILTEEAENDQDLATKLQILGDAHFGLEELEEAESYYTRALELSPRASRAYLSLARLANVQGDRDAALEHVYNALEVDPSNLQAWLTRADLLAEANRPGDALDALNQAEQIQPGNALVLTRKARLALRTGRVEDARGFIDQALAASPDDVDALYTHVTILVQEQKFDEANEIFIQIEDIIRNFDPALLVGGIIKINTGEFAQAEQFLARYVARNPGNLAAQHLLADTYIRRDDPASAIEVLEPALAQAPDDISTMRRLASAYTRQGDIQKAAEFYEMIQQQPVAAASQQAAQRLALIGNALGVRPDAIDTGATGEGDPLATAILVVQDFIEAGQFQEALRETQDYLADFPDNPLLLTMQGEINLRLQDFEAAKRSFGRVLEQNPNFLPGLQGQARAYAQSDGLDAAQEILFDAMERAPQNEAIVLGVAQFLASRQDVENPEDQAVELLERKAEEIDGAPRLRATLARYYLQQGRNGDAARLARELLALADREDVDADARTTIFDLAGRLLVDAGAGEEGLAALEKVIAAQPQNLEAHLTLARAYLMTEQPEKVREALVKAQELDPDNRQILVSLVDLSLRDDDDAAALEIASSFAEIDPVGAALATARVHNHNGDLERAIAELREAQTSLQSTEIALGIYNLLGESGQTDAALNYLSDWVVANPEDGDAKRVLSSALLTSGNLDRAEELYERIIEANPQDPISLNNLAWIKGEQGEFDDAIALARQAQRIVPNSPEITDTLGWLLVRNGNFIEGIRLIEAAARARPQNLDMQYHLAYGLYMTGERGRAREVLTAALSNDAPFSRRAEAEDLLERLGQ